MQRQLGFKFNGESVTAAQTASPAGYKGLYRFHKYWGKKPHEPLAYIIEQLTEPGDVVLDPFMGSGTAAREALLRGRRFIGFDINPAAVEISRLLVHPPSETCLRTAIADVESMAKARIFDSYLLDDGRSVATHYLWDGPDLTSVWLSGRGRSGRQELPPSEHDIALSRSFSTYKSRFIRAPAFFTNSRINACPSMSLDDLLTGRAQHNIDLLIGAVKRCAKEVVPALKLCLTAASGQMTTMVFAVTGRGKTTGQKSERTEVGSWVIGFWRPRLHFEVNVWNCFNVRATALLEALRNGDPLANSIIAESVEDVVAAHADAVLLRGDARSLAAAVPNGSVRLVITDPPHSDRLPYLELSELWNAILGFAPDFDHEIVVSNAKERQKTPQQYQQAMRAFLAQLARLLQANGALVVMFNARQKDQWEAFRSMCGTAPNGEHGGCRYVGYFPCEYSTGSVVQDNRRGSLKHDCALVFVRSDVTDSASTCLSSFENIPNWSKEFPRAEAAS
jgi:hypothetical protein